MKEIGQILYHYFKTKYFLKFKDRQQLKEWQEMKMKHFLKKILPMSPFYRTYYQGNPLEDWANFPTIDKDLMMEHFDTLNTVGIKKAEAMQMALAAEESRDFSPTIHGVTVGLSSGTSGNRGLFLVSGQERARWAGTILAKSLPGSLFQSHRVAFFLRADSNLYNTVNRGKIQFAFYDLLKPLAEQVQQLNHFQPTLLVAPPSMLRLLAQQLEQGQLKIQPQKLISVAEVLDPLDDTYIEEQFNQPVHQIYQCTEGFLGVTCEHGTLHLNEDLVVIQKEYLDREEGKFVPIISDFSRISQPIIRYRLNDILTEKKEPCPCHSPFLAIEQIEGRCDDIFYFKKQGGEELVAVFPDFIRRAIILAAEEIRQYRVVQTELNQLKIWFEREGLDMSQKETIETQIISHLQKLTARLRCTMPEVEFVDEMGLEPGKKLRRIERRFSMELGGEV